MRYKPLYTGIYNDNGRSAHALVDAYIWGERSLESFLSLAAFVIVYLAQDIPPFVMYCVNEESCSSLLKAGSQYDARAGVAALEQIFERRSASVHSVTALHVHNMTLRRSAGSSDATLALASYCEPAFIESTDSDSYSYSSPVDLQRLCRIF